MRALSDDVRTRLVPILEKADVTIDATNAELLRIDGAITKFEEASVRVSAASGTLSDIVQAPGEIVNGVADRVRRAWKDRRRSHADETEHEEAAGYSEEQEAEATPDVDVVLITTEAQKPDSAQAQTESDATDLTNDE